MSKIGVILNGLFLFLLIAAFELPSDFLYWTLFGLGVSAVRAIPADVVRQPVVFHVAAAQTGAGLQAG